MASATGRYVELVFRGDARSVTRAYSEIASGSSATAATVSRSAARQDAALRKTGAAMTSVGRLMMTGGIAAAAGIGIGVKAAVDFNKAVTLIHTQAGASVAEVARQTKYIQAYAESGKSFYGPTGLANALYHVESLNYRGAAAQKFLDVAQKGAAMSGSDLEDTTSALGAAMKATRAPLSQIGATMGVLNAIVGQGNMRMTDLVQALSTGAIPSFRNAGLGIRDFGAALDVATDRGYEASSAAAQMATALHFISSPTAKATKALQSVNIGQGQLAADLHRPEGLLVALTDLQTHLRNLSSVNQEQVLNSIFPGGRGRVMLTLFQNLDALKLKYTAAAAGQTGWAKAVQDFNATPGANFQRLLAVLQADLVRFGGSMIPVVTQILPKMVRVVQALTGWFTRLPAPIKSSLGYLTALSLIFGPIIYSVGKMIKLFTELRAALLAIRGAGIAAAAGEAAAAGAGEAAGVGSLALLSRFGLAGVGVGTAAYLLNKYGTPDAKASQIKGEGGASYYNPRVAPFAQKHAYGGVVTGPPGMDNVPAWLSAGEGVVSRVGMSRIGVGGLNAINTGGGTSGVDETPVQINVDLKVDGRVLAQTVVRQTIRKAARGPSGLVGGSLATGIGS